MFEWLVEEIEEVKTQKYFVVDGPASDELKRAIENEQYGLPQSYKAFVLRFGKVKLHRYRFGYQLGVLAAPIPAEAKSDGEALLCVGNYQDRRAYFKVSQLDDGKESPIFESGPGGIVKAASGFEAWLQQHDAAIRKKLGKRQWAAIVKGPPPFSPEEQAILDARRGHQWRWVETTATGNVVLELTNGSERALPFYSVGVRSMKRDVNGTLRVPTQDLAPGQTRRYERECYNQLIPRDQLELFTLPDPGPEDRESYWEFK